MKTNKVWARPGWPWELELLALVFVIVAIAIPLYLHDLTPPEPQGELSLMAQADLARQQQNEAFQKDSGGFFWAVFIIGLYCAHLAMAGASISFISTSFTHLFTPLLFAMITYYRLYSGDAEASLQLRILENPVGEVLFWVVGVMTITFLIARIRMARYLARFKDTDWKISSRTRYDTSFSQLIPHITPLLYPPRIFRASEEGILIEGRLFVLAIPFNSIQSVGGVRGSTYMSPGKYFATSSKELIRIQLTETTDPIFISPRDHGAFLQFCELHTTKTAATRTGSTTRGTSRGTTSEKP